MKIASIQKAIILLVISFSISLAVDSLYGQGLFKQIKNAANKEINKVISPTISAKSPPVNNQNNIPANTVPANTSSNNSNTKLDRNLWVSDTIPKNVNPVWPATKQESGDLAQKHKPGENNSSAQIRREVYVRVWGIKYERQRSLRNYLNDSVMGIYGTLERASGMTFYELQLNTSLNKNELVKTLIKPFKLWNPALYFIVDTAKDVLIQITMYDKHYTTKEAKSNMKPAATDKNKVNSNEDNDKTFTNPSIKASFPGGDAIFMGYLKENLNLNIPKQNGAALGTYRIFLRFIVAKDGDVSDVEVESKAAGYGMESEAIRIIKEGPNWEPGQESNGGLYGPVKSYTTQVITFTITK